MFLFQYHFCLCMRGRSNTPDHRFPSLPSLFIVPSPESRCIVTTVTSDRGKPVAPSVTHTADPGEFLQYTPPPLLRETGRDRELMMQWVDMNGKYSAAEVKLPVWKECEERWTLGGEELFFCATTFSSVLCLEGRRTCRWRLVPLVLLKLTILH